MSHSSATIFIDFWGLALLATAVQTTRRWGVTTYHLTTVKIHLRIMSNIQYFVRTTVRTISISYLRGLSYYIVVLTSGAMVGV